MATSQRLSRGFHRLGPFMAAMVFLLGTVTSLYTVGGPTYTDLQRHELLVCAHDYLQRAKKQVPAAPIGSSADKQHALTFEEQLKALPSIENDPSRLLFAPDETILNLKRMGCSDSEYETVGLGEARTVSEFSWWPRIAYYFGIGVGLSFLVGLVVYVFVRAIGWVIGGFAAS